MIRHETWLYVLDRVPCFKLRCFGSFDGRLELPRHYDVLARLLRIKLIDITRLELFSVKHTDLLTTKKDDEHRVSHEIDLINLSITTVVPIKLNLFRIIIDVAELDNFVPTDSHQR